MSDALISMCVDTMTAKTINIHQRHEVKLWGEKIAFIIPQTKVKILSIVEIGEPPKCRVCSFDVTAPNVPGVSMSIKSRTKAPPRSTGAVPIKKFPI